MACSNKRGACVRAVGRMPVHDTTKIEDGGMRVVRASIRYSIMRLPQMLHCTELLHIKRETDGGYEGDDLKTPIKYVKKTSWNRANAVILLLLLSASSERSVDSHSQYLESTA